MDSDPEDQRPAGMRSALVVVAAVVLLAGVGALLLRSDVAPSGSAEPLASAPPGLQAAPAPESLPVRELGAFGSEGTVDLADYVGRPLVINFWASWCGPCVAEMPDLQRLHTELGDRVTLLGINTQDAPSAAAELAEETGISYDLAVDRDGSYYNELRGFGMPTTLFVRSDGSVAWRHTGPITFDEARALIAEHLGVAG